MTWRTLRAIVLAAACALLGNVRVPLAQTTTLDVSALLTTYASGRFDEALQTVQRAGDKAAHDLRLQWPVGARLWIDAEPANRSSRLLAAAAFALETERWRAERNDWSTAPELCGGRCVISWAADLLAERGSADDVERRWMLAAIALAEGIRDWSFLNAPVDPRMPFGEGTGFLQRALTRFPGDARLRLDRALAAGSRFNITIDGATRDASPAIPVSVSVAGAGMGRVTPTRQAVRAAVAEELSALGADPVVGAEARVRLGYLDWATGLDEAARTELEAAAGAATDRDIRYLAHYLLGMTFQSRSDTARAIAAYDAALDARPHSQSAALALGALELQRGDAAKAYELTREAFGTQAGEADPWRQFLYGHYAELPKLLADLRGQVAR